MVNTNPLRNELRGFKDRKTMANRIISYIRESRDELKKVLWPSKAETVKYTLLVVGISLGVALFLGAVDFGLNLLVEKLIV